MSVSIGFKSYKCEYAARLWNNSLGTLIPEAFGSEEGVE